MRQYRLQLLTAVLAVAGFFLILGWVGKYDWAEQVILRMSQEQYDSVRQELTELNGHTPSQLEIASWWDEHHPHSE